MRVIAGRYKGRSPKAPTWEGLRPTSDRLRETLFNILAPRIGGARVLDGYAGTGAVGIEALSRGAAAVTFVDRDRRARDLIAENLALCGVTSGCAIIRASFDRRDSFDFILLDPPYDEPPEQVNASAVRRPPRTGHGVGSGPAGAGRAAGSRAREAHGGAGGCRRRRTHASDRLGRLDALVLRMATLAVSPVSFDPLVR